MAYVSGIHISMIELIFMKFRRLPVKAIIEGLIIANKANLKVDKTELEIFALSKGNISNVINGMVVADKNNLNLSFQNATAAYYMGLDIVQEIHNKVLHNKETKLIFD